MAKSRKMKVPATSAGKKGGKGFNNMKRPTSRVLRNGKGK